MVPWYKPRSHKGHFMTSLQAGQGGHDGNGHEWLTRVTLDICYVACMQSDLESTS